MAAALARGLRPGCVVNLEGALGTGKTMFVRGLAHGLGINPEQVSSPTFVICHEYERMPQTQRGDTRLQTATGASIIDVLIHIDAYRIRSIEDLETIGWRDLLHAPSTVLAIEWPSRIFEEIERIESHRRIDVSIAHISEHSRALTMTGPENAIGALRSLGRLDPANASAPDSPTTQLARCRTCGKEIASDTPEFPFCSARCRLAELNKWFNESYRITRPVQEDEELND